MNSGSLSNGTKRLDLNSHRICSAAQTLERITPMMATFGITRVANVTGLDRIGIPVTLAIRPNSRSVAVSQGKGLTLADAKASALMESIEIWHAENLVVPVLYGTEKELSKTRKIVNTALLPVIQGVTYKPEDPMLWVEGRDLISGETKLVPHEMVHANYTRPVPPTHGVFHASTNGLASGNNRLEAICHAITEVIERDAMTLSHLKFCDDQPFTRIDTSSIRNEACAQLLAQFQDANVEVGLWDVTSDTGIPCIKAVIRENGHAEGHMGLGSGCHLDQHVAARRALTEAAQTRLNYISGARDDLAIEEFTHSGKAAKLDWADGVFTAAAKTCDIGTLPGNRFETLEADLDHLLKRLKAVSIDEVIAVDLSHEEKGIAVARVIIPGLESPHDDEGYQEGPRAKAVTR